MILSPMFTEYLISFNDNIPLPHRAFVWSFVNISIVGKYQHILRNLEKENREKKKSRQFGIYGLNQHSIQDNCPYKVRQFYL